MTPYAYVAPPKVPLLVPVSPSDLAADHPLPSPECSCPDLFPAPLSLLGSYWYATAYSCGADSTRTITHTKTENPHEPGSPSHDTWEDAPEQIIETITVDWSNTPQGESTGTSDGDLTREDCGFPETNTDWSPHPPWPGIIYSTEMVIEYADPIPVSLTDESGDPSPPKEGVTPWASRFYAEDGTSAVVANGAYRWHLDLSDWPGPLDDEDAPPWPDGYVYRGAIRWDDVVYETTSTEDTLTRVEVSRVSRSETFEVTRLRRKWTGEVHFSPLLPEVSAGVEIRWEIERARAPGLPPREILEKSVDPFAT